MVDRLRFLVLGSEFLNALSRDKTASSINAKPVHAEWLSARWITVCGLAGLIAAAFSSSACGQSNETSPTKPSETASSEQLEAEPAPVPSGRMGDTYDSAEIRFDDDLAFTSPPQTNVEARLQAILEKTKRLRQMTKQSQAGLGFDKAGVEQDLSKSGGQGVQFQMSDEFATQVWSSAQANAANGTGNGGLGRENASPGNQNSGPVGGVGDSSAAVREIVQRIELLRRLRRESKVAPSEAGGNSDGLPANQGGSTTPRTQRQAAGAIDSGRFVTTPSIDAFDPAAVENSDYASDSSVDPNEVLFGEDVEQILKNPVDAMLLAESLYRTKNYKATLKALEAVDVDAIDDSDHVWVDLLAALSKRRLGDTAAAEAELRDIANIKSRDVAVPAAKFWLKQTEFMQRKQPLMEQLDAEYKTLLERAKSYANPK